MRLRGTFEGQAGGSKKGKMSDWIGLVVILSLVAFAWFLRRRPGEPEPVFLNYKAPWWEIGKADGKFPHWLRYLSDLLPKDSVLHLEGSIPQDVQLLLDSGKIENIARGTTGNWFVPLQVENISNLVRVFEGHPMEETSLSLDAHKDNKVLLTAAWNCEEGEFICISGEISEEKVKSFCNAVECSYHKRQGNIFLKLVDKIFGRWN